MAFKTLDDLDIYYFILEDDIVIKREKIDAVVPPGKNIEVIIYCLPKEVKKRLNILSASMPFIKNYLVGGSRDTKWHPNK